MLLCAVVAMGHCVAEVWLYVLKGWRMNPKHGLNPIGYGPSKCSGNKIATEDVRWFKPEIHKPERALLPP